MNRSLDKAPEAILYTDGSSGINGNGGWSALVATPSYGLEIAGFESKTTNNRMELTAVINGLKALHEPHHVTLVSDSNYVVLAIKHEWYKRWFQEQTQLTIYRRTPRPRPNLDLWLALEPILCYHRVTPIQIKGHNGHEYNERVDKLAVEARKQREERFEVLYGEVLQVNGKVYT